MDALKQEERGAQKDNDDSAGHIIGPFTKAGYGLKAGLLVVSSFIGRMAASWLAAPCPFRSTAMQGQP